MSASPRAFARIVTVVSTAVLLVFGLCLAAFPAQASTSTQSTAVQPTDTSPNGKATGQNQGNQKGKNDIAPADCAKAQPRKKNTVPKAQCFAYGKADSSGNIIVSPNDPPPTALGPSQIQDAYDLPATGDGMTVAIIDAGGYANAESDLQVFRNYYGLPACTTANGCFTKLDQRGGTSYPPEDPSWSIETALDLDAVSSACPKCHILLVEGDSASLDSLGQAAQTASQIPGVVAISNSYGVPGEDPSELTYDHYYDHPGIAVTASTGDYGWLTNWPATNPNVVAVGGTTLTADSSPRGWTETVWDLTGSGCSPYEAKPDYQAGVTTDCTNRAISDVSADADPATGLGIYNTSGESGWAQYGGTSLSAPLVAAMYALAGQPTPGSNPASYAYTDVNQAADFNDVTQGSNGSCGNVLCNGGPGWDGPTGIGTPHGVAGLTQGPHGTLAGTVTSAGTALAGATITATDADGNTFSATSEASGSYTLALPVGTYDVSASEFGYATQSVSGVDVAQDATVTQSFDLAAIPSRTVTGTVSDGSGHGWPMYAKITVDGAPGSVYTNPYTGKYTMRLPQNADYTMHVTSAELPGYQAATQSVHVGTTATQADVSLPVDVFSCSAPGYTASFGGGAGTDFEGWTGSTPQDGWTVSSAIAGAATWEFDDPGHRGNTTGGSGNFAVIDSDHAGSGHSQDTSLVSPVMDFSTDASPEITFNTYYREYSNSVAAVDVTTDGGATWTNVWKYTTTNAVGPQEVPLPQAANQSAVQVRFRYTATWAWWWELDDIVIGTKHCDPVDGALVAGIVKDNNTKAPLDGAKVGVTGDATALAVSHATPDDAGISDGFYELYVPAADLNTGGKAPLTVTDGKYDPATANLAVVLDTVTTKNWLLKAGHLTVSSTGVSVTEQLGVAKSKTFTLTNDGTDSVHVKLAEKGSGFTPMSGESTSGAPLTKVAGVHTMGALTKPAKGQVAKQAKSATESSSGVVADDAWTSIADLPSAIMDNAAVTVDGKVYSFGGTDGFSNLNKTYVYDPDAGAWTQKSNVPAALEKPSAEAVDGMIYVFGGWDTSGNAATGVYKYDPSSDSWSTMASLPTGVVAPGTAVLDGKIYAVGGCTTGNCAPGTNATQVYDPSSNSWSQAANYPSVNGWFACSGLDGLIYCAGGSNPASGAESKATYAYDPGSDSWTQRADMPYANWAMVSTGANGMMQVAQGVTGGFAVNSAVQYDPSADAWSTLPNANQSVYRGAGACGFYSLGGSTGGFSPIPAAEELPGYNECASTTDTPWLSADPMEFDVAAGATVTVTVTMDSTAVDQPGTYTSGLSVSTNSPYSVPAVTTTMNVNPPLSWAKIKGTVSSGGTPLKGATVQVCTMYIKSTGMCGPVTYTLSTDTDGYYQLWLASGYDPLSVIAAKDGYQPKMAIVRITKGATTTTNFALLKN